MGQYIIVDGVAYASMEAYYQQKEREAASNSQISGVSGVGDWGSPAEQEYQMRQNQMKAEFQSEADRAAAANPNSVNTVISPENPPYSFGNYVVPRDVYYGIHGPNTTERYKAAKAYLEGVTGVTIGGGDRAAPGTTGTVTVDSQGRTIPNYGRNTRDTYDYSGTQSMSLLAGSVQKMAFVPESIRSVMVKGEGMKLAIPTSRLGDDNPWNPSIINTRTTERARTITQSLIGERPGFDASLGRTMEENAENIQKFEKLRKGALEAGNVGAALEYSRKEQAAAQNLNELSRAYHQAGKIMGVPIAANPFEAAGDLGVEFLKGTPVRDAERFSPISGELINSLPLAVTKTRGVSVTHGLGLQSDTWNAAMNRERGLPVVVNDFGKAADYIANAVKTGYQGPYGDLYGGKNWQGTTVDRPLGAIVGGADIGILVMPPAAVPKPVQMVELENGMKMPAPFVSVSRSAQDITKQPDLPRSDAGMVLPAPFISISAPASQRVDISALPAPFKSVSDPAVADTGIKPMTDYERSILGGYSGGLIGYALWGEKSPEVIKGLIGASIFDATAGVIDLSGALGTRNKPAITQADYDRQFAGYSGNLTAFNAKADLFNARYSGELSPETYQRAQVEYGNLKSIENALLSEKASVESAGILLMSQKNEKWGEFSKWSAGAGEQISSIFGIKRDALEAYGKVLESSKAGSASDRIGYGFTKTMATDPGQVLSGAGAGGIWALGGAVIGGGTAAVAGGGGRLAPAAAKALQFGNSPVGRAIPLTAFGGLTLYSASEGGTAGTSKTLMNLGGDVPGLAAMGAGNIALKRAFQSPRFGFKTESPRKPDIGENRLMEVYGTTEPRFVGDMIRQQSIEASFSLKQNKPLNINEFTEPTMTVGERARVLKGLSQAKNTPMNLDAARALLSKVPEPPMDIGKAALKYGPAGERPVYEPSTTIRTSKPIEAAPSWESTFRSPSIEPASGSRVIEPKMQLQPEPAAKTKTVLKYKEPVDVERLNRLLRPKDLNIKTEAEYRKALPTYDELKKRGYDWNVALRMTPSAKPVTSPATGVYQDVKPHWSIPSALEAEAISERSFAQSKTRDYDTLRATLPKQASLTRQAQIPDVLRAVAPKQAVITRQREMPDMFRASVPKQSPMTRKLQQPDAFAVPVPAIVPKPEKGGTFNPVNPPTPPMPIPLVFNIPSGGGGRDFGFYGKTGWTKQNLIADMRYLENLGRRMSAPLPSRSRTTKRKPKAGKRR